MAETPEALNAELLARIARLEQRIVTLQAELAKRRSERGATLPADFANNIHNDRMDDREFREFVRRVVS